ncbi:cation-transporting P-type ATPase [Methanobacterium sp.]|uniref:cation-transporting P-type ATPase n=1 Tax=Methanobacterium sp. TaxID=2164 RepID=UPI0025F2111C|nr:cation-transporting P-type ATPase [Methanobacterium sp.]
MKINELPPEGVYGELNSSKSGLTTEDAQERLEKYGANQIEEVKKKPVIFKFLANLYQLLALLLWAASILAFLSGTPQLGLPLSQLSLSTLFSVSGRSTRPNRHWRP